MSAEVSYPVQGARQQPVEWDRDRFMTVDAVAELLGWPVADVEARIGKELRARWVQHPDGQVAPAVITKNVVHLQRVLGDQAAKDRRQEDHADRQERMQRLRELRKKRIAGIGLDELANRRRERRRNLEKASYALRILIGGVSGQWNDDDPDLAEFVAWASVIGEYQRSLSRACRAMEDQVGKFADEWVLESDAGDPYAAMAEAAGMFAESRELLKRGESLARAAEAIMGRIEVPRDPTL